MVIDRDLAYIDSFIWYPEQNNDIELPDRDYAPITVTEDDITLLISTNRESFKRVLSSILVGADLIYPDISHKVAFDYLREFDYPMSICSLIIECIQNDEDVKNALALWLQESGSGVPANGGDTTIGTDNTYLSGTNILGESCDGDDLAGQCVAIIEYLNQTAQDWIEGMVAFTLPAEIAGYAAQSIPVMNSSGVDFGDIADWIVDEVLTQYVGAYDEALRNEAACLLLEKCCNDCNLTLDDILDAFAPEIGVNIDPATAWAALLEDIVLLSVPDEIVYGVWQLICATWKIGAQFLGVSGINALAYAASKFDPIDPASIGCDPCAANECFLPFSDLALNQTTEFDCISVINGYFVGGDATHHAEYRDAALNPRNVEIDYLISDSGITSVDVSMRLVVLENNRHYWRVQCFDASNNIVSDTGQIQRDDVSPVLVSTTRTSSGADIKRVKLSHFRASGGFGAYYGIREVSIQNGA